MHVAVQVEIDSAVAAAGDSPAPSLPPPPIAPEAPHGQQFTPAEKKAFHRRKDHEKCRASRVAARVFNPLSTSARPAIYEKHLSNGLGVTPAEWDCRSSKVAASGFVGSRTRPDPQDYSLDMLTRDGFKVLPWDKGSVPHRATSLALQLILPP